MELIRCNCEVLSVLISVYLHILGNENGINTRGIKEKHGKPPVIDRRLAVMRLVDALEGELYLLDGGLSGRG